ncbi:aldo/keto reductase [Paenibacillus agricola]|uniref:Aldo/keto reductase n=1 Tax=Paenibacillus agricola TaxID=2716264 RepID=A0ABX0IZS8_9BACL|nr:aldo/keto reductase [Paenibacillus agricola]NHN29489.1 aldo/keto reductase [Paenibacillus agricola]
MEHRRLGNTGLKVSVISLGCMAFGRWIDEKTSLQVFDAALDAGITLFDTADIYGRGMDSRNPLQSGESEAILGRIIQKRRSKIILATKVNGKVGLGPNDHGLSRYHITRAIEDSLKRLQTDVIDLYQVHRFDPDTPLEETLGALDDLVKQGKVRYIGCSNYAAWQIAKAHGISQQKGLNRFVSVQPPYSLLVRDIEQELLPFCESEGVGAIVYSPLARGLLTGKYVDGGAHPAGSRADRADRALLALLAKPQILQNVCKLQEFANERGWSLPCMALAWVAKRAGVASAILGASRPEHVQAIEGLAEIKLQEEDMVVLDSICTSPSG